MTDYFKKNAFFITSRYLWIFFRNRLVRLTILNLLSPGGMKEKRHQSGRSGTGTVVGQQGVLELVLAHYELRELHVQLILRPEDLHVLGHAGREVLHRPRPQYRVLVLKKKKNNK